MENYGEASIRHYKDSLFLSENSRLDNAGHLIGFAAECAIKHAIRTIKNHNPAYKHFPEIIDIAKKHLSGRSAAQFNTILKQDLFQSWKMEHRYLANGTVTVETYSKWRKDTQRLMGAAGLKL